MRNTYNKVDIFQYRYSLKKSLKYIETWHCTFCVWTYNQNFRTPFSMHKMMSIFELRLLSQCIQYNFTLNILFLPIMVQQRTKSVAKAAVTRDTFKADKCHEKLEVAQSAASLFSACSSRQQFPAYISSCTYCITKPQYYRIFISATTISCENHS